MSLFAPNPKLAAFARAKKPANKTAPSFTADQLEARARKLYRPNEVIHPTWDQLGETTKSVWRERAAR